MKPKKKPTKKTAKTALDTTLGLPTGTLTVTVDKFRSLGALTPLEATLSDWSGFKMPKGQPMPQPEPTLEIIDNNIVISSEYPIRLIYNLPDPNYVLIGAAWEELPLKVVGKTTFPDVRMQRNLTFPAPDLPPVIGGSCLTVTDNAQDPGVYEYVLMIQDAKTAELGMFDPGIDNHPEQ